ncbi:MAG: pyridoxamine 5'-phosphate oxidase family protein [Bacteroidales bacterium]|nr:pyridoxamine 5'-phosphate oxidase family protein [Bacteroidales bacterium]MDY0142314.1 pyridoxamine 5'-phosphate oxidase family protein [Bacteroidales bacterium]
MLLKKEVLEIFKNEKCHQFATVSIDGTPNICNVGAKYMRDDGKIVVIDNFMNKTLANIKENPEVAILIRREKESYQIKGTANYLTAGKEYDEAYKWMKSIGEKYPARGAIIITVHSVYNSITGPTAGDRVQ